MRPIRATLVAASCLAALLHPLQAHSATDDAALDLVPAASDTPKKANERALRLFVEVAAGRLSQRYGLAAEDARRASLDLNWEYRPSPQWRAVISDRLDDVRWRQRSSGAR